MFYSLHVVEPLRYDSVLIKETNEWMNEWMSFNNTVLYQFYCCQYNDTCIHVRHELVMAYHLNLTHTHIINTIISEVVLAPSFARCLAPPPSRPRGQSQSSAPKRCSTAAPLYLCSTFIRLVCTRVTHTAPHFWGSRKFGEFLSAASLNQSINQS